MGEQGQTPLMAAIKMRKGGEEMVRQLLDAKADVNLMAWVISLSTFRVVSEEVCHSDVCSMMSKLPVVYKKNLCNGWIQHQEDIWSLKRFGSLRMSLNAKHMKKEVEPSTHAACSLEQR